MKILQITRQFYPFTGGIESVVYHLSHALLALGNTVEVATLNRQWRDRKILSSHEVIQGIRIRRIPYIGSSHYAIAPEIIRLVRGFDLLHLHSSDFFLDYLALTKPYHHTPFILHTHGLYFHTKFAAGIKKIYLQTITKLAIRQASMIICDSQHDRNLLKGIVNPNKVELIPNGVNITVTDDVKIFRDRYLILSVGRLSSNKRYHLLLETFARVQSRFQSAQLVIIGKDQGELIGLQKLAKRFQISEKVHFLDEVSEDILRQWLSRANVWVTSSGYESFGIAVLEAMASGCIPVVQHLEAFEDFLKEGVNGFFTDFTNPDQAAETIARVIDFNEDEYKKISKKCIEAAQQFQWNSIASRFNEIYTRILID